MGKVLVVKNNSSLNEIHKYAELSYTENKRYYYNSVDGSINEDTLKDIKDNFEGNGIILMLSYNISEPKEIVDMFIGSDAKINEKNSIEYTMKVYLNNKDNKRTIKSIIDKMDLDIVKDFGPGHYVLMSDMDSLYQELHERILSTDRRNDYNSVKDEESITETYELSAFAQKDNQSVRIFASDGAGAFRTEFQRDRERVVNCKAFRRLVDKAQIFGAEKGDYYRTRMTHSLEVNQIAKAIAYALKLNLDLTEAIALGHDLGHTPFGHQGERTLDDILSGKTRVGIAASTELFDCRCFGGFKHNYQSARVLTELEEKYSELSGLNVSVQVIEGVLKHTKLKPKDIKIEDFLSKQYLDKIYIDSEQDIQVCSCIEGQVVAIADEIAQRGHDVDDALTSGVMTIAEFTDRLKIPKCQDLNRKIEGEIRKIDSSKHLIVDKKELTIARIVSAIVNYFIENTINYSLENIKKHPEVKNVGLNNKLKVVDFSPEIKNVNAYLERVVQKKVICNTEVARADHNASMIVQTLFAKYYNNPRLLHAGTIHKIFLETLRHSNEKVSCSAIDLNDGSIKLVNEEIKEITANLLDTEMVLKYCENPDNSGEDKNIIIFEKRKILIRAIVDYIAGMTDGYALEEYEKLK